VEEEFLVAVNMYQFIYYYRLDIRIVILCSVLWFNFSCQYISEAVARQHQDRCRIQAYEAARIQRMG